MASTSSSFFEDDDEVTLSLLLLPLSSTITTSKPNEEESNKLINDRLPGLSKRFLSDLSFLYDDGPGADFYKTLIAKAQTLGLNIRHKSTVPDKSSETNGPSSSASSFPAAFQSEKGKAHLSAASSLLGVSESRAVSITLSALRSLDHSRDDDDNNNTNKINDAKSSFSKKNDSKMESLSSLLGTRMLLLLVRDYYYSQQISRIRFVAEALRLEQQPPQEEETADSSHSSSSVIEKNREACVGFLNDLDGLATLQSSSDTSGMKERRRALFEILISLACAPTQSLGRNQLYPAFALRSSSDRGRSATQSTLFVGESTDSVASYQDFAKELTEQHSDHFGGTLRTEALEALLVLLYERIDGGTDRSDYLLLLLGLDCQNFFASPANRKSRNWARSGKGRTNFLSEINRRSQLTALILGESMSLWRATDSSSSSSWISNHPFFRGEKETVEIELNLIGKSLLLERYSNQVLERRQFILSEKQKIRDVHDAVMADNYDFLGGEDDGDDDDDVEVPESIAILTFGLLLKLASKSDSLMQEDPSWSSSMKELAVECISIANDVCGAFAYLHHVMSSLLPPSNVKCDSNVCIDTPKNEEEFDWMKYSLNNSFDGDSTLKLTDGKDDMQKMQDIESLDETEEEESAAAVAYASIGREVLTGTLSAFRHSLLGDISSTSEENMGMLCNLTAQIYRNTSALCSRFWMDWDAYCTARAAAATSSETVDADPLCLLLDAAYTLACTALANHKKQYGESIDDGRHYLSILPSLMPLLCLISSLIPCQGGMVQEVLTTFLPENLLHICLVGCVHICSFSDTFSSSRTKEQEEERRRYLQMAKYIMSALQTLAHLVGKGDDASIHLLRVSLEPQRNVAFDDEGNRAMLVSSSEISGPRLLYLIANKAITNRSLDGKSRVAVSASALYTIAELVQYRATDDLKWIAEVGICFEQSDAPGSDTGFEKFSTGNMNDQTLASMIVLQKMSSNVTQMAFMDVIDERTLSRYINTVGNGALVACDILSSATRNQLNNLSNTHLRIVQGALSAVYTLLKSLRCVLGYHAEDSIRNTARCVRDGLIEGVSSSTTLGNNLAYYAVLPVSLGLTDALEKFAKKQDLLIEARGEGGNPKKEKYGAWATFMREDEKKDNEDRSTPLSFQAYSSSLCSDIDKVLLPEGDFFLPLSTMLQTSCIAISFVQLWGDISEQMVLEKYGIVDDTHQSIADSSVGPSTEERKQMAEDVMSLGPCCLLLSLATPPFSVDRSHNHCWPENGVSYLNLISRYLSCCRLMDDSIAEKFPESLATKSSDLISLCLRHVNYHKIVSNRGFVSGGSSKIGSVPNALGGSSQVRNVLLRALRSLFEEKGTDNVQITLTLHLLKLLGLIIKCCPSFAKQVLLSEPDSGKDESEIADLMVKILSRLESSSILLSNALLASSAIDVVAELWNGCRECGDRTKDSSHPCGCIAFDPAFHQKLLSACGSILLHHDWITNQKYVAEDSNGDAVNFEAVGAFAKAALLNVGAKALAFFTDETLPLLYNDEASVGKKDGVTIVNSTISELKLEDLCEEMTQFDGSIFSAQCNKHFLNLAKESKWHIFHLSLTSSDISIILTDDFTLNKASLFKLLVSGYSASKLAENQVALISSWSKFMEIFSTFQFSKVQRALATTETVTPPAGITSPTSLVTLTRREEAVSFDEVLDMSRQTIFALERCADSTISALSTSSSLDQTSIIIKATIAAYNISNALVTELNFYNKMRQKSAGVPLNQINQIINMLGQLLQSTERYFSITEPSIPKQPKNVQCMGCELRLNLFTSVILLIAAVKDEKSEALDEKRLNIAQLGLCRLACDSLNSLRYTSIHTRRTSNTSMFYEYNFESIDSEGRGDIQAKLSWTSFNLLRTSISLLTTLLPGTGKVSCQKNSSSSRAHESNIAATLQKCKAVPLLFKHLEVASNAAAEVYQVSSGTTELQRHNSVHAATIHDNSVDIIRRIIDFTLFLAGSKNLDLSIMLLENHFIRSLVNSRVLLCACEKWSSMPNTTEQSSFSSSYARGYIQAQNSHLSDSFLVPTKNIYAPSAIEKVSIIDPVHDVWRAVIRSVTALLRSFRVADSYRMNSTKPSSNLAFQQCLKSVVNFVSTFEGPMLSCLKGFSTQVESNNLQVPSGSLSGNTFMSPSASTPSSSFAFTPNAIKEARDILSLISELCAGESQKYFESSSSDIYQNFLTAALDLTKTISSFLGAVGTARELFCALSSLNGSIEDKDGVVGDASSCIHESLIWHPLFADGVPNARHEAIRNAHYASSCCICITTGDYTLSMSDSNPVDKSSSDSKDASLSLEQSFQSHVNNDFTTMVEHIATQCIFNALSIIEKTHPASSSFAVFDENESIHLHVSSLLEKGALVAIRPPQGSAILGFGSERKVSSNSSCSDVNYARVLSCNVLTNTLDVEYLETSWSNDGDLVERNISCSRLAGVEDETKKLCVFEYSPAPRSVAESADTIESSKLSLGHLILCLRWCHMHASVGTKRCAGSGASELVHGIVECASMLLGTEISLHLELGTHKGVSEDTHKNINEQLMDLFEEEEMLQNFSLSSPASVNSNSIHGIKALMENDVWAVVIRQLANSLNEGKLQREMARRNLEQNFGGTIGTLGWGHSLRRGKRRSPFRMSL